MCSVNVSVDGVKDRMVDLAEAALRLGEASQRGKSCVRVS